MSKLTPEEVRDIVFTPNDAVVAAIKTIEDRRTHVGVGVKMGLGVVDDYMLPGRPGELITILGMTSNYKSGLMQFWARYVANDIVESQIENECVIYVTWEQAIEEMLTFDLSATARLSVTDVLRGQISEDEMERLRLIHGPRRAVMPVYLIGHSLAEGHKRPHLTLSAIGQALMYIREEFGVKPRIVFLDYLQLMQSEGGEDRRMQIFRNVQRSKDMALAMACPVVLAVQANRETYNEAWGVPRITSGLESSAIEHTSDKSLGVWMPKTTHEVGKQLVVKEATLEVTENLLILKLLKQKMGPAGKWWSLYVDPAHNLIAEMEIEHVDLSGNGYSR